MSRYGCRSLLAGPLGATVSARTAGLSFSARKKVSASLVCASLAVAAGCGALGDSHPAEPSGVAAPAYLREASGPTPPVSVAAPLNLGQLAEPPPEPAEAAAEAKPSVVWRFRSAAPVSGAPAVSAGGFVYVATVEGYVHALEPSGAFRWSYGLVGMPIGGPAVDPSGRVYVATSAQRLYALRPDGRLGWMQHARARFATPPVWASPGLVYYAGRDRNLYSVAQWNGEPQRRYLGHAVSSALASLGEGVVAVGTSAADAQVFRRASLVARLELDAEAAQPLLGGKGHWFAVTRGGIAAFDLTSRELVWSAQAQRAALSEDERVLVVQRERELCWLSPQTGAELRRAPLPGEVSALPVVTRSGVAVVPLVSGDLVVIEPHSGRVARVKVAPAPAWSPVWSEQSRRLTAAAGGVVVGVDLSAWSAAWSPGSEGAEPPPAESEGAATGGAAGGNAARPGIGSTPLGAHGAEGGA